MAKNKKLKKLHLTLKRKKTNFIIGISVLIIISILFVISFKQLTSKNDVLKEKTTLTKIKELFTGNKESEILEPTIYTVKDGDYLWKIAEEAYGSGYKAFDIAKANKLENPDFLEKGQELMLPNQENDLSEALDKLAAQEKDIDMNYTVLKGDHLWGIAQKAYGDPYMWVKIAEANKLVNPNYIEVGQKLYIP